MSIHRRLCQYVFSWGERIGTLKLFVIIEFAHSKNSIRHWWTMKSKQLFRILILIASLSIFAAGDEPKTLPWSGRFANLTLDCLEDAYSLHILLGRISAKFRIMLLLIPWSSTVHSTTFLGAVPSRWMVRPGSKNKGTLSEQSLCKFLRFLKVECVWSLHSWSWNHLRTNMIIK